MILLVPKKYVSFFAFLNFLNEKYDDLFLSVNDKMMLELG